MPSPAEAAAFMRRAAEEIDEYGDLIDHCTRVSLEEDRRTRLTSEPQHFIRPGVLMERTLRTADGLADAAESSDNKDDEVTNNR